MTDAGNHVDSLPVDTITGNALDQMSHPGYYPGHSTLAQRDFWDEATRNAILHRLDNLPPIEFFNADEVPLVQAVCDRILPQDDRLPEVRIPIINHIDFNLAKNVTKGYRFADMPPDDEAFRLGLKGIEAIAQHMFGVSFVDLDHLRQDEVLFTLHDAKPPAGEDVWDRMRVDHFWLLLVHSVVDTYYAHPWAWDEIGFGGPAYPRGYIRLEQGLPEPWEVREKRYTWQAPRDSLSGEYRQLGGTARHHPPTTGTH